MRSLLPALIFPAPSWACELALLFAVDVSGSVDHREFDLQMSGLAAALQDGIVAEALVRQQSRLALLQWTGSSRQRLTIDWHLIDSHADLAAFSDMVRNDERVWRNYSTAIGEALDAAIASFPRKAKCTRRVIDVSGDGPSNEGLEPAEIRQRLSLAGITVNGLAIETDDHDLTAYFFENVIHGARAFVMRADGFEDYPEQIKRKLRRETERQFSAAVP